MGGMVQLLERCMGGMVLFLERRRGGMVFSSRGVGVVWFSSSRDVGGGMV